LDWLNECVFVLLAQMVNCLLHERMNHSFNIYKLVEGNLSIYLSINLLFVCVCTLFTNWCMKNLSIYLVFVCVCVDEVGDVRWLCGGSDLLFVCMYDLAVPP
jgi:hypothetical protein